MKLKGKFVGWVIGKLTGAAPRDVELEVMGGMLGAAPTVMVGLTREAPTRLRDERAAITLAPADALDLGGEVVAEACARLGLHPDPTVARSAEEQVQVRRAMIVAVTLARALYSAKFTWQDAEERVGESLLGLVDSPFTLAETAVSFVYRDKERR